MVDIINAFFKRHYPANLSSEKFRRSAMRGGMMNEYVGNSFERIFPEMKCADGFHMSVQGHYGAYSRPRDDFAEHYTHVEVGFPSEREELLMPYIDGGRDTDPTDTVYGYVPVEVVALIIMAHGGFIKEDETQ